ncbi:DMT family transporter [Megasphaera hexanoica]|uniref:DMT family transporter n=1 Tax=Megasphaera hexanoica TaxID=1675036 RepID=A0A848BRF2_9FIRM|nr:DMT family transporter [Megasphaera hexanoica]NME28951.1 DMT family transporter [Megasphaera hexanoica]
MKDSYIKFILATVIFGTNGIIASHIPLSSYEIVLCRTVLGGTFLFILALCRRQWHVLFTAPRRSLVWLVLSGIFLAGNWLFLYEAYQQIGVSLATLICYFGPVLIMILSRFVFHEPFTLPKVAGMIIVTGGMICINGADFQANGLSWGLVCGLLCALCFALLIVAMKKTAGISGIISPACQLLVASLVVGLVTCTMSSGPAALDGTAIACILCLGIVNTGIGYSLYFSGIQNLSAQTVSICGYIEPLTALALSGLLLGEVLTAVQWLGAVLVLGGVALSELWHRRA